MTDPALFSDAPKRYHPFVADLFEEVFRAFPEARRFDPCPCGIAMAIIPSACVQTWHFPIPDHALRERARKRLLGSAFAQYDGADGVLVLTELA